MKNGPTHLLGRNVKTTIATKQHYSVVLPNVKRILSLKAGSMSFCNREGTAARRDGPILGTRSILELD